MKADTGHFSVKLHLKSFIAAFRCEKNCTIRKTLMKLDAGRHTLPAIFQNDRKLEGKIERTAALPSTVSRVKPIFFLLKQFRGKQRLLQEVGWTGPSNAELNTAFIVLGADACSFENLVRPFTFCLSRCFLLKEYSALSKIFHFEVCERKIVVVKKLVKIICLLYFKKNKGKDQEINKQNSLNFCLC